MHSWSEHHKPPSASNKKPRHRHAPHQLAALNQLFDQDEHPPLDLRSALAERLGMETKTVNAWFQNKRASSKKRSRSGPVPQESQPPVPPPPPPKSLDYHPPDDDDYPFADLQHSRSASLVPSDYLYSANPEHAQFYSESESIRRKMRNRPSSDQTDQLRRLYSINPNPTAEQRHALSVNIGMRYQSITNWFQNQRSMAKKRDDEPDSPTHDDYAHDTRHYSAFPPPPPHLQSAFPSPTDLPNATRPAQRRSPSVSPSIASHSPRRSSTRRHSTPYSNTPANFTRPRRSRPEPFQLDALKLLFAKTSTPDIDQRLALAHEIGMDVGKVTNWFRNLRQTAKKRTKKSGSGDDEDDDSFLGRDLYSSTTSRFGTPSFGSSSSSINDDGMDVDDYDVHHTHSGSEEDYQEAVTPPEVSPPPRRGLNSRNDYSALNSPSSPYPISMDKVSEKQFPGVKYEDALLLLSFHRHIVH